MRQDYSTFLDGTANEPDPPFDPIDWLTEKRKPPIVEHRPGLLENVLSFVGDRLGAAFSSPKPVDIGRFLSQDFDNDEQELEYNPSFTDALSALMVQPALGITGTEFAGSQAAGTIKNPKVLDAIAEALDRVKNNVSGINVAPKSGSLGQYFPKTRGIDLNIDKIEKVMKSYRGKDLGKYTKGTAFHELFHEKDNAAFEALMRRLTEAGEDIMVPGAGGRTLLGSVPTNNEHFPYATDLIERLSKGVISGEVDVRKLSPRLKNIISDLYERREGMIEGVQPLKRAFERGNLEDALYPAMMQPPPGTKRFPYRYGANNILTEIGDTFEYGTSLWELESLANMFSHLMEPATEGAASLPKGVRMYLDFIGELAQEAR